jgi:tRNA nucleotidyltransferase (CCA-adding enzyme)
MKLMTEDRVRLVERSIPGAVRTIQSVLADEGYRTWLVGGSLRDLLRGASGAKDWDLATDAKPEQVQKLFKRVVPTGIQHGTVTVLINKESFEVTTLRGEGSYSDGRHPDSVHFVEDIHEDLSRRDFTINAIAYDLAHRILVDPFGGLEDLERRVIRAVGDARMRFSEDGLRVLRAARFAAVLGFDVAGDTLAAIRPTLQSFAKVSAERVRDEWVKALASPKPSRAFEIMRDHGLLEMSAPTLVVPGREAALALALDAVDQAPPSIPIRLASLFHNVAEAPVEEAPAASEEPPLYARQSAQLAEAFMESLKFSNAERARVTALVRHQAVLDTASVSDATLRRWLCLVTPELSKDLLVLMGVLARVRKGPEGERTVVALSGRIKAVLAENPALTLRDLDLGGKDLVTELGIPPGRVIGETLRQLLASVLDDPSLNERERLLELAKGILQNAN